MSIFYSPSRQGFFDEAIHGPRTLLVPDDAKLAELLAEADAARDDEDEEIEVERQKKAMLAIKETENPDCLIPADAIEVSDEQHAALIAALSDGKIITTDGGTLIAVDRDVPIDEQLEAIRRRRNRALKTTDWTQAPDALTAAKRKLWADHRQALRDLPGLVEKAVKAGKAAKSVPFPKPPS